MKQIISRKTKIVIILSTVVMLVFPCLIRINPPIRMAIPAAIREQTRPQQMIFANGQFFLRSAFFLFFSSIRFLKNEHILLFATIFLIFNKKKFTYDGI